MKIKAIVVDDEQHAIDSFCSIASEAYPQLEMIGSFTRPDDFLAYINQENGPDILFLDIEMSPYSGFRLLELIREKFDSDLQFDVIFLTAYNQYAIKAFKYNALDYLLKPLMPDDLLTSIHHWENKKDKHLHPVQLRQLGQFFSNPQKKPDRMAMPTLEGYIILLFKDIIRCEADRNYVKIYCADGHNQLVCRSLKDVEQILSNHGFLRVHHSHIINPDFITRILKSDGGAVVMADGSDIRITRNKQENMAALFERIEKL